MKNIIKIIISIICTYILIGKSATSAFYLLNMGLHLENLFLIFIPNLIVIGGVIICFQILWQANFKSLTISPTIYLLIYALLMQILFGFWEFLNKDPNVNQYKIILLGDIPNCLSILLLIFLIIFMTKKC